MREETGPEAITQTTAVVVTRLKPQLGNVETRSMESTPHPSGLEGEEFREELEAQSIWRSPTPRIAS